MKILLNIIKNSNNEFRHNEKLNCYKNGTRSKSTQSNSRTAYRLRVMARGNSDSYKQNKNK